MVNPLSINISYPKIVVAVCVYNRFENIQRWINCWKLCESGSAELVIIHNNYGDTELKNKFEDYCKLNGITYISRNGQGFDIGAFKDVCQQKLTGFPQFDYILWCCDDTIPMSKDFVTPFISTLKSGVGISCMQISVSKPGGIKHVRTTGFCITKDISTRLNFGVIKTKQDCYLFEHLGGKQTMTEQIRAMGLSCQQVAPNSVSPLWDTGYWKRLDRYNEHQITFGGKLSGDKVVFICPIFNMYPQIISSLLCQTHKNWELILIYNGPCDNNLPEIVKQSADSRIRFIEYPEATGKWGHKLRQWALKEIGRGQLSDADYVCISNADNYYTPVFIEYLLKGFNKSHTTIATYCSETVHSYKAWQVLPAKLERGYLDCGAVIVKRAVATEIGWSNINEHSADWVYFSEIAQKYSWKNFISIKGCLFVHN